MTDFRFSTVDDESQLEQLVDRGLCAVLDRLGMICDEKAGHIAASQDPKR